ncbi:MAG: glycosyltransferase, partial [Solirubrobacteraceae bacterium]
MVLFVSYSGALGGAERLLVEYASTLKGRRALACPEGALASAARAAGLRVLALPQRSLALRGKPVAATMRLAAHARELRRLQRDLGAELVVAWGMRSAIAAAAAGSRFVFAHNDLVPGPVVGGAVRAAARRARAVVVLSHAIAADLGAGAITVIHPGVDVDSFDGAARDPALAPEV